MGVVEEDTVGVFLDGSAEFAFCDADSRDLKGDTGVAG